MRGELRLFFTALQFFTRVPVPAWVGWSAAQLNASARHFPSVGWVVGAVVGAVLWGATQLWTPGVAAWLAIAAGVLLTGAFHEDGLADSCDGFGGGWQRDQVLAIMKDSRVGSYATLGVVITLGLKVQLLSLLAERAWGLWPVLGVTVAAHTLSRWGVLWIMARLDYVREDALSKSKPIAQGIGRGVALRIAAEGGLLSALMAEKGITGSSEILEGRFGYYPVYHRGKYDRNELVDGLGSKWLVMDVSIKPAYPCCKYTHGPIEASAAAAKELGVRPEDIEKITVYGSKVTVDHVGWKYRPEGLTSAQLNLPYCVATLLLDGDVFVDQFTEAMVADPERMRVSEIVSVKEDPAITARGNRYRHMVRVEVHLNSGKKMERTVEAGRGNENNFASEADICEKFEKLAIKALPKTQVHKLRDAMLNLESLKDAGEIARLMQKA